MKILLPILILVFTISIRGQQYTPLLNESLFWDVPVSEPGYICPGYSDEGPYRYKISGDTTINNLVYSKVYFSSFISQLEPPAPNCPPFAVDTNFTLVPVFLREDIVEKKVWRYMAINNPEEILLFDFSVGQGDTIVYEGFPDIVIDTIFNIVTGDGILRKRFEFGPEGSFPGGYFIEGIGGAGGLLEIPFFAFEGGTWLQCVKNTEGLIVWDNTSLCFDFITGISGSYDDNIFKLFPNPFNDFINIESDREPVLVSIYDLPGNELYSTKINKKGIIDLDFISPGLYILRVFINDDIFYSKKIIKTER